MLFMVPPIMVTCVCMFGGLPHFAESLGSCESECPCVCVCAAAASQKSAFALRTSLGLRSF